MYVHILKYGCMFGVGPIISQEGILNDSAKSINKIKGKIVVMANKIWLRYFKNA